MLEKYGCLTIKTPENAGKLFWGGFPIQNQPGFHGIPWVWGGSLILRQTPCGFHKTSEGSNYAGVNRIEASATQLVHYIVLLEKMFNLIILSYLSASNCLEMN